jgi:hypothetical protein
MDIEEYISALDKNTGDILQVLKECSEEQIEKKQDGKWSILETLEHILITDRHVYALLTRPAEKQGETPEIIGGEKMKRFMIDMRERKTIAPEWLLPKGDIKNNAAFIEQFLKQRAFLVTALENGEISIDNGIHKHFAMGELSKRDWLSFILYHAGRHLLQIKDKLSALN